jgi:hypothetical protein
VEPETGRSRLTVMARYLLRGVTILAVLVLLAGCAARDGAGSSTVPGPTVTSTAPGTAVQVTLVRTGGLPGVNDRVVVDGSGNWTATDRTGKQRSGQLTAQQRDQLARLATSGRLAAEAARPSQPARCMDAYSYTVTVAQNTVSYVDCPGDGARPETAAAIVELLTDAALR